LHEEVLPLRTRVVIHVYCRTDNEWVVFETGRFPDRVAHSSFEEAVEVGRWLSEAAGAPLRIHAEDLRAHTSD